MKLDLNCGSCMVKQALSAMKWHQIASDRQVEIIGKIISDIPEYLDEPTPSHFQTILLKKLSEYLEIEDIYREEKQLQDNAALSLRPFSLEQILNSPDPLFSSALFAVEGNIIDLTFFEKYDMKAVLQNVLKHNFSINHYESFVSLLSRSKNITYIVDNAGEIVFDQLFIEQCQKWRCAHALPPVVFTVIVKSEPTLNDAMESDAFLIGLNKMCTIIKSGSNYLGLPLEKSSPEARSAVEHSDMIIAKGQANFETLEAEKDLYGKIFFLLKTKCVHVAAFLGVPIESLVFYYPN